MVSTISIKIFRVRPCTNRMGTNTQTVVRVEAIMAPVTCLAPVMAASITGTPSLRSR